MDKNIIHIPNFLNDSEFEEINTIIDKFTLDDDYPGWKLTGFSNINTTNPIWMINLRNNKIFSDHYCNIIKNKLSNSIKENICMYDVYLNGSTHGQQGYYHTDFNSSNGRTLLIYFNKEWNEEWAGGTVFNENGKITTIYPKPLSAVYFKSMIPHFSQPLSANFIGLRKILAYKFVLE